YKNMVVECNADDLVVSAAITGTPASWLKPSLVAAGRDPDDLGGPATRDYSGDNSKRWRDIWAAGQGVGRTRGIETVAEVVVDLEREYNAAIARFKSITA
ncbi:MAG: nitronate monooxygenase, partial [Terricaulis sp.]